VSARLLEGRRAVVTGASRGIGAAVAERFAAEGASLVLVARTLDHRDHLAGSLNATLDRCRPYGGETHAVVADLTDGEDRSRIIPEAVGLLGGPVDVLVNNAAAAIYGSMADYALKRRRITFEVNVHAPFDLLQAALPGMREQGGGWVVNVSSATSGYQPGTAGRRSRTNPIMGVYGASKAALERLSFAFAQELVPDRVRVNTVAPRAAVRTEGMEALMGDRIAPADIESMEAMVEAILLLARGPAELTGGTYVSLDLLEEQAVKVMGLDGEALPSS
jgi:citronellol/citronellal dehydrogenase